MRSSAIAAALFAGLLLAASPVFAGPPAPAEKKAAEADAAKASRALARRDFGAAADAYERAYRQVPNAKWLFSAANARRSNGEAVHAANHYARYLKEAPENAAQRAAAKKELAALAAKLGRFEIQAEGAKLVRIDGEEVEPTIGPVYVDAGPHVVEGDFETGRAKETATASIGKIVTVVLAPPAPEPPRVEATAVVASSEGTPATAERKKPLPPLAVWVGAGATLLAGGLTIASGLDVLGQKESFDAERSQANLDAGRSKQLRTNVLIAVTGAAAALTGVVAIWFVDWRSPDKESSVKIGAGPSSIVLRSTF